MDLRLRVLRDADAGLPSDELAEQYSVSRAWVDRLKPRRRETGEVAPRTQTRWRTPILHAQLAELAALIREQPDRTLAECVVAWRASASQASAAPRLVRGVGTRLVRAGDGGAHGVQALCCLRTQCSRRFGLEVGHAWLSWCVVCGLERARTAAMSPVRATRPQTGTRSSRCMSHVLVPAS